MRFHLFAEQEAAIHVCLLSGVRVRRAKEINRPYAPSLAERYRTG
jgi:hypothetical protein